ncbi:MAG TPA: hypothetical protein VKV25_08095, partial [Acidimicrobiales bacterium]|nr:hypothetical protein [Acidimicrobiales bacterium]
GAVVFLAVLAARAVGRAWDRSGPAARRGSGAVGLAVVLLCAAGFVWTLTPPAHTSRAVALGRWLEAHHLHDGVGAYWASNLTTVLSDGRVRVRPVVAHGRVLFRYQRESSVAWYEGHEFNFLVYIPKAPWGGVDLATATATYGRPDHVAMVAGLYEVLIWSRPFRVSPQGSTVVSARAFSAFRVSAGARALQPGVDGPGPARPPQR